MVVDWDEMKSGRNRAQRGFGFDIASLVFEGETLELADDRRDYGETRVQALGEVDGRLLQVTYTDRAFEVRWIISARPASRKERRAWHAR